MAFTKEGTLNLLNSAELIKDFLNENYNPNNYDDRELYKIISHASNISLILSSELENRAATFTQKGIEYKELAEYRRKEANEECSKMFNLN